MESIDYSVEQNSGNDCLFKIIGGIILLISLSLSIVLTVQNWNLRKKLALQSSQFEKQLLSNQKESVELTEKDILKEKEISYFVKDILPQYPQFENISANSILNLRTYHLKGLENQSSGWFIETENNETKSYYLVSNLVQKKLLNVMVPYVGESAQCELTKVVTTGNENELNRDLLDKNGYIVIAGENCEAYGGGNSVSIFSLTTGEKVKLTGNFSVTGTSWKGTTSLGTATGKLIGVYGVNNPQIVVSYGGDSWKGAVEEIRQIALFDLQTGKLIRVENFE